MGLEDQMSKQKRMEVFYKLRCWSDENHRKILTENEIWFADPSSFNDPFDTVITTDYTLLDTYEKKLEYAEKFFDNNRIDCLRNSGSKKGAINFILGRLKDIVQYQKDWDELYFDSHNKSIGVFSATKNIYSNVMWGHYANNHEGFAVSLKIDPFLWITNKWCTNCGPTIYGEAFPKIDPLKDRLISTIHDEINYKSKDWEYEDEYRLIRSDYSRKEILKRNFTMPSSSITGIYLGLKMLKKHEIDIISIAKRKKLPVFRMSKVPRSFRLEPIQIL